MSTDLKLSDPAISEGKGSQEGLFKPPLVTFVEAEEAD